MIGVDDVGLGSSAESPWVGSLLLCKIKKLDYIMHRFL